MSTFIVKIETFPLSQKLGQFVAECCMTVEALRAEAERLTKAPISRWYLQKKALEGEDIHDSLSELTKMMNSWSLEAAGFTPESLVCVEEEGNFPPRPLITAILNARLDVMAVLIKRGCSVRTSAHPCDYEAPLFVATGVKMHSVAIIKLLLSSGAPLWGADALSQTVLHAAVKAKNIEAIKFLLSLDRSLISAEDYRGATPFHVAITNHSHEIVALFLNECDFNSQNKKGETALHIAAGVPNSTAIKMLCSRGCNTDARTREEGNISLHCAADIEDPDLIDVLAHGTDINTPNRQGDVPLHYSVRRGYRKLTRCLLRRGADPKFANSKGVTPAHVSMKPIISAMLTTYGSDTNAVDEKGRTALLYHCTEFFREHLQTSLENIQTLIDNGSDIAATMPDGSTVLHSRGLTAAMFAVLLAEGANPMAVNQKGETPLHIAAGRARVPIIDLLVSYGADWHAKDANGRSPLERLREHLKSAYIHDDAHRIRLKEMASMDL